MASADELRAGYAARRQDALNRMSQMAMARNAYMLEEQKKAERAAALARAQGEAAQKEQGSNWLNMAGTGAMVGSAGGPWGAVIGGAIGAGVGIYGSMKSGNSFGDAVTHPVGHKWDGMADIPVLQAGATAGRLSSGNPGAVGAKANQDKQLEMWRNQQASAGMAGVGGGPSPGVGQLGPAYGSTYGGYRPAQYGQAYGGLPFG